MTQKKTGTYEWAQANENCCHGCPNDCRYCYARRMAMRFHREDADTWAIMHPNLKKKPKLHKGRVMFPTSHDLPFKHLDWWFPYLERLLELGNDVLIVTKPEFSSVAFMCDHLGQYKDKMEFRFTIGTMSDQIREYWEPGAPEINERLDAAELAGVCGFRTSVSMEPLLMMDPVPFIRDLKQVVHGEIWIGCMNHMTFDPAIPEHQYQMQVQSRENMKSVWDQTHTDPQIRYKDSVRELLGLP